MARHRPDRIEGPGRVGRAAGAAARYAARKGIKRGVRAVLARSASTATTAAAAGGGAPVAAVVLGVLAAIVALLLVVAIFAVIVFGVAGAASAACSSSEPPRATLRAARGDPPPNLIPWLIDAANQPSARLGVRGAAVLAGIAKVESDFGRSPARGIRSGVNFLGCCAGPFQFNLRDTWAGYADDPGADADGDGRVDVYSFADAAFAAARKLASQGAPEDWNSALLAYNRSTRYVADVLAHADAFQGQIAASDGGAAPPDPVAAEACAEKLSDSGGSGGSGGGFGEPLGPLPDEALPRMKRIADWIDKQRYVYCYGGGHAPKPGLSASTQWCRKQDVRKTFVDPGQKGIDCSGAVRWLFVLTGYPDPGGITAVQFAGVYPRGPGRHVTIWSNGGHVFITIDGRGWGTSNSNPFGGPGWLSSYSTGGFDPSHPPGL